MKNFFFDPDILNTVAGGRSVLDMSRLQVKTLESANAFLKTYGFDIDQPQQLETLWQQHRRALVLMTEKLGFVESDIPDQIKDRKSLLDIRQLLLYASHTDSAELQRWACAVLRCMHVFIHAENDLFSFFAKEIQEQILNSFEPFIHHSGGQVFLGSQVDLTEKIPLTHFQTKPFKNTSSAVIKLLARPDALAMRVFDKIGLRFVTHSIYDSFQVLRFLVQENMVSFPHIMPDQSSNNVYPVELFLSVCEKLKNQKTVTQEQVNELFLSELELSGDAALFRKSNGQTDLNFKFIKFISRQLIRIKKDNQDEGFHFFYPFEIQIMDQASFELASAGPTEHNAYKNRQIEAAFQRIMPSQKVSPS